MLRRKDAVEQLIRQERNRQHALVGRPNVAGAVPGTIDRVLAALDETLRELEGALAAQLRAHPALHADAKRRRRVPGIGAKNVAYLLVLVHRWLTLTDGQGTETGLAADSELDPPTAERGPSVQRRAVIARRGDQAVRRRGCMGALGGCAAPTRCGPALSAWSGGASPSWSPWWPPRARCAPGPGPASAARRGSTPRATCPRPAPLRLTRGLLHAPPRVRLALQERICTSSGRLELS